MKRIVCVVAAMAALSISSSAFAQNATGFSASLRLGYGLGMGDEAKDS